jgi:hypothetical protein
MLESLLKKKITKLPQVYGGPATDGRRLLAVLIEIADRIESLEEQVAALDTRTGSK